MVALITGAIGIVTAVAIMILIRKDHLQVRYGLWWMAAAIMFASLGLFPAFFDKFAKIIGISYSPILALTIGILVLVIKILVMDIERSRNAARLNRLVQRIALLESDLRELQKHGQLRASEVVPATDHGELESANNK